MKLQMRYVTSRAGRDGRPRWYWQRKGWPLKRLPDDLVLMHVEADRLNAIADKARKKPVAMPARDGTVGWLAERWRQTDRFQALAQESRRAYEQWLRAIEARYDHIPVAGMTRRVVVEFLDLIPTPASRKIAAAVLRGMLAHARYLGLVAVNEADNLRLVGPRKRQVYWSYADGRAFLAACDAAPQGRVVREFWTLLLYTGQRPGDALRMTWAAYDGLTLRFRQQKTGRLMDMPLHRNLKAMLDDMPRRALTIIAHGDGRPLTYDQARVRFVAVRDAAGLGHLQLRDLRRTAVVRLAEAGCTVPEIASITGHAVEATQQIMDVYFVRTPETASAAVAKWERKGPGV